MLQGSLKRAAASLAATACGIAIALAAAAPASAHAALVGSDPEDGAALEVAPESVSATFSEILDGPSTTLAVTDPDGRVLEVPAPEFEDDTFTQPMRYTVPGDYTVGFRVISEDGHRIDGSIAFSVAEIPEELLAEPAPTATESGAPTATSDASERVEEPAAQEDSNTGAALATILLAVLVFVIGGVLLVKLLGRKDS